MRTRHNALEVAQDTFVHKKTGQIVVIQGMCHVSDASFFEEVNREIKAHEEQGFDIHFERVKKSTDPVNSKAPTRLMGITQIKLAEIIGLQHQMKAITYKDEWVNTDITEDELLGHMSPAAKAKAKAAQDKLEKSLDEHNLSEEDLKLVRASLRRVLVYLPLISTIASLFSKNITGIPDAVLIHRRNQVAVDAIAATDAHVYTMWGAAHLKGIGNLLKKQGFKHTNRTWYKAVYGKA